MAKLSIIIIALLMGVAVGYYFLYRSRDVNLEANPKKQTAEVFEKVNKEYVDTLGFSFSYPSTYSFSTFGESKDETGQTILLQNNDGKNGIQILITPFDEQVDLTAARIKKELPDLVMEKTKEISFGIDDKKIKAVEFESTNNLSTRTFELWFVREKRLYQISSPIYSSDIFDKITGTWKFK